MINISVKSAIASLIGLLTFLLMLVFRSKQQLADSLSFAWDAKQGVDLFSPHHLIFTPAIRIIYLIGQFFSDEFDVILAGQIHNSIWAVICIVSVFYLIHVASKSISLATIGSLTILSSHLFWIFGTQLEVYIPSLACASLLMFWFFRKPLLQFTFKDELIAALLWGLAILYHQNSVLLIFPIIGLHISIPGTLKNLSALLLSAGAVVLGIYIAVYSSISESPTIIGFVHFCVKDSVAHPSNYLGSFNHFFDSSEQFKMAYYHFYIFFIKHWVDQIPKVVLIASTVLFYVVNIACVALTNRQKKIRTYAIVWLVSSLLFVWWWTAHWEFYILLITPIFLLIWFLVSDVSSLISRFLPLSSNRILKVVFIIVISLQLKANASYYLLMHEQQSPGVEEAAYLLSKGDKATKYLVPFGTKLHLLYHHNFQDVGITENLFIYYYTKDSVPELYRQSSEEGLIMYLWHFNPWFSSEGNTGWSHPQEWLDFVSDVFDARIQNDSLNIKRFKIIPHPKDRPPLLKVIPERLTIPNNPDFFFSLLDKKVSMLGNEKEVVYSDWWKKNKDTLTWLD